MAYAFVQAIGNSAGSGTTVVLTFGGAVAAGNKIVVQIYVNANRTFTVSENGTGTALVWRSVRRNQIGATAEPFHEVFEADNVDKTGLTAVTITLNSTTSETKYATGAEYSGLVAGANVGVGFFQAASASGVASATTSDMTPSAVPCALISFAIGDLVIGSRPLDTSSPTAYLTNNRVSEMTNQMRLGDQRGTVSQNETVTWSWSGGSQRMGLALAAFEEVATGPTIDTQPTAQTAVLASSAEAEFTVAATTSGGTLLYDWELEDGVASGVYADVANGNGATWTGQAGATLTGTFTATTLTGRRVRCNVSDDNGTTTTDAVALTVLDGAVLSADSGTTNGSGQVVVALSSDDALTANGELLLITATVGGVTVRTTARPSTP